jgi:hypothetical protein
VIRYFSAFLGGFLAIFAHIYLYAGRGNWLAPQRLAPALGNALIFAHIFALIIYLANEKRLAWPLRIILSLILGILAWWAHLFFYLYQTMPDLLTLILGGFGLSIGFTLSAFINSLPLRSGGGVLSLRAAEKVGRGLLRFGLSFITTTLAIYTPIYWSFQNFLATITSQPAQALLYFQADNPEHVYLIGIPFALCLAFFGNLSLLFSQPSETKTPLNKEE